MPNPKIPWATNEKKFGPDNVFTCYVVHKERVLQIDILSLKVHIFSPHICKTIGLYIFKDDIFGTVQKLELQLDGALEPEGEHLLAVADEEVDLTREHPLLHERGNAHRVVLSLHDDFAQDHYRPGSLRANKGKVS